MDGTLLFLWILMVFQPFQTATAVNMTTMLDDLFRHYDRRIPPRHDQANKQVEIQINIHVMSMYSISAPNMDYSMAMLIGQKWSDERLQFNDVLNFTRLELDNSLFNHAWTPDLFILNEHSSDFHEVMVPNKFVHIYPNGTVHHLARVTGTYSCHMLLHKYPFDTQHCHIEVGSSNAAITPVELFYSSLSNICSLTSKAATTTVEFHSSLLNNPAFVGHRLENIKFVWHDESLTIDEAVDFPQFCLTNIREYNCERDFLGSVYPCIGLEFTLKRNSSFYIIEVYIPSILIVVLSWMSFWIDCTAVPARVSLGLLTVLTMTTQSSASKTDLSHVSYVKALDVYLTTCLACVFLGLLEFAYVNVLTQRDSTKIINVKERNYPDDNNAVETTNTEYSTSSCCASGNITLSFNSKSGIERARFVDNVSKILFPGTFTVFNIIYWIYYLR